MQILYMSIAIQSSYWLIIYSISNLPGNKFVNGIIVGAADASAAIVVGFFLKLMPDFRVFQIFSALACVSVMVQYVLMSGASITVDGDIETSFWNYFCLFTAFLGIGGQTHLQWIFP